MSEHEQGQLRRRLGMSRRDLIRRGAVVGGTLIWTVPVVKTISSAHEAKTQSPYFTCCVCRNPQGDVVQCQPTANTAAECASLCGVDSTATTRYEFHTGAAPITCTATGPQAGRGCGTHGT